MFILFQVPLINKNGTKSMHCIIRGKFVISPCRKSALFWIHAVILLFHAEILPCGPPLLPHSCAEPFLGVMQKYSFLGDIYTSVLEHQKMVRYNISPHLLYVCFLAFLVVFGTQKCCQNFD